MQLETVFDLASLTKPIATASSLVLNADDLRELERQGGAADYLARRSRMWLWFWTRLVQTNGGPIFDALAVVTATRPELVSLEKRYAKMNESGNLVVSGLTSGRRRIRYCSRFAPETKRFVMQRLGGRLGRE